MSNGVEQKIGELRGGYKALNARMDRFEVRTEKNFDEVKQEVKDNSFFRVRVIATTGAVVLFISVLSGYIVQALNGIT